MAGAATPDLGKGVNIGGTPQTDASKNGWWWIFKDQAGNLYIRQQAGAQIPGLNAVGYALGTSDNAKSAGWFGTKLHEALSVLGANGKQGAAATQFFDAGGFIQGQTALLIDPSGKSTGKPSTSEAVYSPIIPEGPASGTLDAIGGLFGGLSSWEDLALRILQALAGFALLLLGLQALTGTGGQGKPLQTIKRYA